MSVNFERAPLLSQAILDAKGQDCSPVHEQQDKNNQENFEQILGKRPRETTPPLSKEEGNFSCEFCGYSTKYKQNLTKHMRTHDEGRELAYLKHEVVTGADGKRLYPCTLCDK